MTKYPEKERVKRETEVALSAPRGKKHDAVDGKRKRTWHLFPLDALRSVADVLRFGAYEKPQPDGTLGYGADNWELVPEARERYYNAAMRHLTDWYDARPPRVDNESKLPLLAHAGCCVLFLLALELRGKFVDPEE